MAVVILSVWMFFVLAFLLVRIFYADVVPERRSRKQIRGQKKYDAFGYDRRGFTSLGYHRNGTRYDDEGYDRDGLDVNGNPRPIKNETVTLDGQTYDSDGKIRINEQNRKRLLMTFISILAVALIVVPVVNYIFFDSCILGHNPVEISCEKPVICIDCEKPVEEARGHTWINDKKTGQEVCVKCRTKRSDTQ